jgi:hypothetical protein
LPAYLYSTTTLYYGWTIIFSVIEGTEGGEAGRGMAGLLLDGAKLTYCMEPRLSFEKE